MNLFDQILRADATNSLFDLSMVLPHTRTENHHISRIVRKKSIAQLFAIDIIRASDQANDEKSRDAEIDRLM